jgi:hypothetical protein
LGPAAVIGAWDLSGFRRITPAERDIMIEYGSGFIPIPAGHEPLLCPDEESLPLGLCDNREDHARHLHQSESLGRFVCTADQSQREPYRSEVRRAQN